MNFNFISSSDPNEILLSLLNPTSKTTSPFKVNTQNRQEFTSSSNIELLKWQSNDQIISFEPISNCDWIKMINGLVVEKYSFVSFNPNSNQTLILFDSIDKSFVTLDKNVYMFGKNLS